MPGDVTLGELGRRIDRVSADLKDDLAAVTIRLDGKVRSDVFRLEQQAQDARITALEARVTTLENLHKDEAKQRSADRRWLLAVLIFPVVLIVISTGLQILLAVLGVL